VSRLEGIRLGGMSSCPDEEYPDLVMNEEEVSTDKEAQDRCKKGDILVEHDREGNLQ
jgi:hypothetical protein